MTVCLYISGYSIGRQYVCKDPESQHQWQRDTFKLDTDVKVTAISKGTWKVLREPTLQPSYKHLFSPTHQTLSVLGKISCHLTHKQHSSQQSSFVVDGFNSNLLSLPAVTALHFAVRTDLVQTHSQQVTS